MIVVNRGNIPTFARHEQKLFTGTTTCTYTDTLYDSITYWKVEDGEKKFSQHRNIYYQIQAAGERKTNKQEQRWRLREAKIPALTNTLKVEISKLNGTPAMEEYTKIIQKA